MSVSGLSPGSHQITLIAKDKNGNINASSIRIKIVPAPPVAFAGPNRNVTVGEPVQFNANQSSGFGHIVYQWDIISKPNGSKTRLFEKTGLLTNFIPDFPGKYVVQLFIKDDTGMGSVNRATIYSKLTPQSKCLLDC